MSFSVLREGQALLSMMDQMGPIDQGETSLNNQPGQEIQDDSEDLFGSDEQDDPFITNDELHFQYPSDSPSAAFDGFELTLPQPQNGKPQGEPAAGLELPMLEQWTAPQSQQQQEQPQAQQLPPQDLQLLQLEPLLEFNQSEQYPSLQSPQFPGNAFVDFSGVNQHDYGQPTSYAQPGYVQQGYPQQEFFQLDRSNTMSPSSPKSHPRRRQMGHVPPNVPEVNAYGFAPAGPSTRRTRSITRSMTLGQQPQLGPGIGQFGSQQYFPPQQQGYQTVRKPPAPPKEMPPPPPPQVNGRKINVNRKLKDDPSNQPSLVYEKLPPVAPWGPLDAKDEPIFKYFQDSPELWPQRSYTRQEIIMFLLGQHEVLPISGPRRRPRDDQIRNPPRAGKLTVWVQNTPAQSNTRYRAGESSGKCRYADCPVKNKTILKGFFRVAFDENSELTSNGTADPFHNAGYMHLFCFEEIFDLGFLVHWADLLWGFEVLPDARVLPKENKNRMSLTRDHQELLDVFHEWQGEQAMRVFPKVQKVASKQPDGISVGAMGTVKKRSPNDYLWRRLTKMHLDLEVDGRGATRKQRGGAHIGEHVGDLRKFLQLKTAMKRRRQDDDSEEEEEREPEVELQPPPRKRKAPSKPAAQPKQANVNTAAAKSKPPAPYADISPLSPEMQQFVGNYLTQNNLPSGYGNGYIPSGNGYVPNGNGYIANGYYPGPPPPPFNPTPPRQSPPNHFEQLRQINTQQQNRPLTRAMSKASASAAQSALASPEHMSRQTMEDLVEIVAPQPPHVREQIISGAPPHAGQLLQSRLPTSPTLMVSGNLTGRFPHQDNLEDRVGALNKRDRRDVSKYVEKREEEKDPRRTHTD